MKIEFKTITSGKELQAYMDRKFNPQVKKFICNEFARLIDPWVPFRTGTLAQGLAIGEDFIYYNAPYAHYMYEGIVYGPNFALLDDGSICFGKPPEDAIIVGWRSPKGKGSKHPTGRKIKYSKEMHQQASAHWDKVAMQTQLPVFKQEIEKILVEDRDGR